jgi:hypothetical protein
LDWISLESTVFARVRYLPDLRVLQLGLRTGKAYQYLDVPAETYRALLAAESKGRYYNRHIRNDFQYRQIQNNTAR